MNKKILMPMVAILVIGFVMAGYYALLGFEVVVNQPISIDGSGLVDINCDAGNICVGEVVTISNEGTEDREVSVLVEDWNNDLTTGIAGELIMSKKDIINWTLLGDTETVRYSIIGEVFKVWDIPTGYVAVYYPNTETYEHYDGVIVLAEDVEGNLPIVEDLNSGNNSDYCTNGFNPNPKMCQGAKLWLVPITAVTENVIDWGSASEFYFETDLITYTDDTIGITTVLIPSGESVNIYPQVTIDLYALGGSYPVEVTVA